MLILMAFFYGMSVCVGEVYAVTEGDFPVEDPTTHGITPALDYDGLLPDVQQVIDAGGTGVSDNWVVFRDTQDVYLEFNEDGEPVNISSTQWSYWLIFFDESYDFNWRMQSRTTDAGLTVFVWPQLQIEAPVIHKYRLNSSDFEDRYVTDAELNASAGNAQWEYFGVVSEYELLTGYDSQKWTFGSTLTPLLGHTFIASSVDVNIDREQLAWYIYYEEDSLVPQYFQYTIPAHSFPVQTYDGYLVGDSGDDSGGGTSVAGWLAKIYNVVKNGFEDVLDALTGNKDEVVEEEEEEGFSLKNLIEIVLGGLKKIVFGVGKWVLGGFADIGSAISDFFGVFDGSNAVAGEGEGLFNWFSEQIFAVDVAQVSAFFGSLWAMFPSPVRSLINFSFGAFIAFAVFKMFLH